MRLPRILDCTFYNSYMYVLLLRCTIVSDISTFKFVLRNDQWHRNEGYKEVGIICIFLPGGGGVINKKSIQQIDKKAPREISER